MASEIARLRQEIASQHEAAMYGLNGLASGTTRHTFITNRMQRMGACMEALKEMVGPKEAGEMMAETLSVFPDQMNPLPC